MNVKEAKGLLARGQEGLREWNTRHDHGEVIPTISDFNLERTDLSGFDFNGVRFKDVQFTGVNFRGADFREASLENLRIINADFTGADLRDAKMNRVSLGPTVSLARTDLRGIRGLRLNGEYIAGAIFSSGADEPWHQLMRTYTESRMVFNLLFLSIAFAPHVVQAFIYQGISKLQSAALLIDQVERVTQITPPHPKVTVYPMWQALLSWNKPALLCIAAIVLIAYNIARLAVTWWITGLYDRQQQDGHAPIYIKYAPAVWLHRNLIRWVGMLSLVSGMVHIFLWLGSPVPLLPG